MFKISAAVLGNVAFESATGFLRYGAGLFGLAGYDWDLSIWQMEVSLTQIFAKKSWK